MVFPFWLFIKTFFINFFIFFYIFFFCIFIFFLLIFVMKYSGTNWYMFSICLLLKVLSQFGHLYKVCSLFSSFGSSKFGIISVFFGCLISCFVVRVFCFMFSKSISNAIAFFFIWVLKFGIFFPILKINQYILLIFFPYLFSFASYSIFYFLLFIFFLL